MVQAVYIDRNAARRRKKYSRSLFVLITLSALFLMSIYSLVYLAKKKPVIISTLAVKAKPAQAKVLQDKVIEERLSHSVNMNGIHEAVIARQIGDKIILMADDSAQDDNRKVSHKHKTG